LLSLRALVNDNLAFLTALSIPLLSYSLYKIYPYIEPLFLSIRYTNQHGGSLVAKTLKAHGVKYVFTLVGGHISPILVASKQEGIQVIDVRSECTTVFAADAVSRLSGTPGVAVVTAGPGVTNTITAMKNAQMAQSPLVLIGGAAATLLKGRGSLQDVEQIDVLRSIVKFHASIANVREIVPTMRRAFHEATSGVPGPVFIEMPIDVLYCVGEVSAAMGLGQCLRKKALNPNSAEYTRVMVPYEFKQREVALRYDPALIRAYLDTQTAEQPIFINAPKKRLPWFLRAYLSYQMRLLFAGAFSRSYKFGPITIEPLAPSKSDINKIIALLLKAQRPCILISSQALLDSPRAHDIRRAVERLLIPTFLSSMARGLLGRTHALYVKQGRTKALREADVILLVGTMVDFRLDYGRQLNRRAKIVSVNRSYADLRANTDLFWKPCLAMQCDPGRALLMLADRVGQSDVAAQYAKVSRGPFEKWRAGLKEAEQAKESDNAKRAQSAAYPRPALGMKTDVKQVLNPIALCQQIEKYMADDAIMIVDGGDFAATAAYICKPRGPLKWLDPGPFGTLGVGMGFALGAKLVDPNAEIWLIWGDGSSGYSIAEVDTFRRFGIGVICVIGNDACWSQIEREQIPKLGDNTACMLSYCDYHTIAKGFGGDGEEVHLKKQIEDESDNCFLRAKEFVRKNNAPYIINAHIGTSNFREGSISV